MRFRQETVGVACDIEQMFHCFYVDPKDRDVLRFFWFKDNNLNEEIVEYDMTVHLFGNTSSPAVATFGLRKTAVDDEEKFGESAKKFVCNDFYVDDGLTPRRTAEEVIHVIKTTQTMLSTANIRLHKVASNSVQVMAIRRDTPQSSRFSNQRFVCKESNGNGVVNWSRFPEESRPSRGFEGRVLFGGGRS